MSTSSQPPFSFTSSPINMPFDGGFRLPENCGNRLGFSQPTPATANDQLYVGQRSIPEHTPLFSDPHHPWYLNQVCHDPDASAHTSCMQMPLNLGLWSLSTVQQVPGVLPLPSLSTMVNEGDMSSASYAAYDPSQNAPHWNSQAAFDHPRTLWSTSSERQPLSPLVQVDQESGTLHHFFDQSTAHPSHVYSSHATYPHYPYSEPSTSIPHYTPSYQSFTPTSLHFGSHPTSHGFLETGSPCYRVPHRNFGSLSRHRRAARAIKYDGLWTDEEELFRGVAEPDGQLTVHQCHWEEDHSPCHLWIIGDKSSINAHIQKWHGGKPGGEKLPTDCRWSACGKTMLKESIARHIVNIHLGETWECQGCGKGIVRSDAYGRHAERSEFDACRTSGALITYSTNAQVIDARAALGGGVGYASA